MVLGKLKSFYPDWVELDFNDITVKFHNDLMDFVLYKEGLSINYAGTLTARLKTFMNDSLIKGLHTNRDIEQFKRISEEVDKIALSTDDLKKLAKIKITISGYDIARDLFMIQCVTGLRYSDVELLTMDNIRGKFLEVKTQKTGKPVTINIHAELQKILDKYDGFPPKMSKEKVNLYIKEVAKFAKLTDKVIIETTVKGQKVRTSHFLWELISTHTGRRTALTNMARQGIDLNSIRLVSGHTTIKQLQTYLKIDSEESATKLIDHPFYKSF
jgi:integrase